MVLGLAVGPEPGAACPPAAFSASGDVAVLVPRHRLVFLVELEVGAGGVEEQQVHLEVEQVRDLAEDLPLHRVADLVQPVHRPVARVVAGLGQPVDPGFAAHPVRGGELGGGVQRPVGDQGEQHPLRGGVAAGRAEPGGQDRADAQPLPQLVQQPRPAEGDRPGVGQARLPQRRRPARLQQPAQRPGQPLDRGLVDLVLAAEVVQHPHLRRLGGRVPLVVDQLQVAHRGAVLVPPRRGAHEHVTRSYAAKPQPSDEHTETCH